jgi:hypothetical protein
LADWVVISSLATAGGTLALAGTTFLSVRSANRAARFAERSLLASLRPLLLPSQAQDPVQKVGFMDAKWFQVGGGGVVAEVSDTAIYLVISLRNVAAGIAVLHGWRFQKAHAARAGERPDPDSFIRLTRDLYVPAGDIGFWQGTYRDPASPEFAAAREAIEARANLTVELLYGDLEGGQRMISRYGLLPREDGGWIASAARHWHVDAPDPR